MCEKRKGHQGHNLLLMDKLKDQQKANPGKMVSLAETQGFKNN